VATVIGLADRLFDPDGLLGGEEDIGITCALIPRDVQGITIGNRHDPMGVPFQNGPTSGADVFVPVDFVIGGQDGVGQGWKMLMESLAAGRSVSLPSLSVAAVELAARATGAYATVREQFNLPIGRFEGIEEPLARIAGHAYLMNAVRVLTCAAVDAGEKPAVLSAVAKAYLTDAMRTSVIDGMDIMAGAAICSGPRNILSRIYVSAPIGITVEGANILTRSLIIFGQGSIRCHPFVRAEMQAVATGDLKGFDKAFFGHLGFVGVNAVRSFVLALTGARLAAAPMAGPSAKYFKALTRYSASFALLTDVCLGTLGGSLKRREKISGRLADAFAWLYLASATLKRFHDDGRPKADVALLKWSCDLALWNIQEALLGVLDNLPSRPASWAARLLIFPTGARRRPPDDELGAEVARGLLDGDETRLRLTADIFIPDADEPGLGRLEAALHLVVGAKDANAKVKDAVRAGTLDKEPLATLIERAGAQGVINADELISLQAAEAARDDVIQVDQFDPETHAGFMG
jgi:acyl-CoA dehydrogenase